MDGISMATIKQKLKNELVPVLLGADQNCYSVARAFHEEYGVVSHAFGRYPLGDTKHSKIVIFHTEPLINEDVTAVEILRRFAEANADKTLVVMGCTDEYAALLIRCKPLLEDKYLVPYTDAPLMDRLVDKADFYALCEEKGIPYPKTAVFSAPADEASLSEQALGFSYPVIVKPSSSIEYWKHPFEGMKKVYRAKDSTEAKRIIDEIYAAGYSARMIVQDVVPGEDSGMRVYTVYSDKNCRVKMACLGHVLLEEHTPKGLGNHAAIITEPLTEVCRRLQEVLEEIGFRGFSNFDLKYDPRDGELKVFEINLRQGRSNHYITSSGINIARLVVEDYVLGEDMPYTEQTESFYWHSIPSKIVYSYVDDPLYAEQARQLEKAGRAAMPLQYTYDLRGNLMRRVYVFEHLRRQKKKYAAYCRRYR